MTKYTVYYAGMLRYEGTEYEMDGGRPIFQYPVLEGTQVTIFVHEPNNPYQIRRDYDTLATPAGEPLRAKERKVTYL